MACHIAREGYTSLLPMGLYRRSHAPLRVRRRASLFTSIAAVALISLAVVAVHFWQGDADQFSIGHGELSRGHDELSRGSEARHLAEKKCSKASASSGYWEDPLIGRPYRDSSRKYLIFIHIIGIGYMLLGLNTVCDLYFTGALDEMVNKWDIKPDVAGATFMAAGGSAPELFTSLIGATISPSDVGFSTIVGSAVFNVLFVIGLCGFAAKEPIKLTWWPLARDCTYYIAGLSVLALFAKTGNKVELWEAIILFLGYIGYCVLMYYNPILEEKVYGTTTAVTEMTPVTPVADTGSTQDAEKHHIKKSQPHFERRSMGVVSSGKSKENITDGVTEKELDKAEKGSEKAASGGKGDDDENDKGDENEKDDEEDEEDDIEALLEKPTGTGPQILWYLSLPVYGSLYFGIPKPTEKMFLATFTVSLLWIAFFSFFLVYFVEILGEIMHIHIIIMGFTLLAAGTSIPDLVSSMAVARAGEGDMAVSSSIGSNIFDILVGLPIPWVIKIVFKDVAIESKSLSDSFVEISSPYITLYVIILIFMVFCVIVSIHVLNWYLNKTLGVCMAGLYALFLAIVLTVEFLEEACNGPEALKF